MADSNPTDVLDLLMQQVHQRAATLPAGSYTTQLLQAGISLMGEKILEEAAEVVEAARQSSSTDNGQLIYESCDLIYHLWVLLGSRGITVQDLRTELARRQGVSGLEEKRARGAKSDSESSQ
jgi:phosphoribosyl-ATP pyrophosphohydrolase